MEEENSVPVGFYYGIGDHERCGIKVVVKEFLFTYSDYCNKSAISFATILYSSEGGFTFSVSTVFDFLL